jgi:hypothetical protein
MNEVVYNAKSFIVEVQNCSTPNEKSTYHKKDYHCYVAKPAKKMHASHKQARVHDTTVIDRNIIDVPYNYKKAATQRDAFKKSDVPEFITGPLTENASLSVEDEEWLTDHLMILRGMVEKHPHS